MRFMMIVKASADSEAGKLPTGEEIAAMSSYNEELIKAGIVLAMEGLQASSQGARLRFDGDQVKVTDGPFAETHELVAGFWIIDVKDQDEAMAWARRIPFSHGEEVELRKVHEVADFTPDAASEEHLRKEQAWRDATVKPVTH